MAANASSKDPYVPGLSTPTHNYSLQKLHTYLVRTRTAREARLPLMTQRLLEIFDLVVSLPTKLIVRVQYALAYHQRHP